MPTDTKIVTFDAALGAPTGRLGACGPEVVVQRILMGGARSYRLGEHLHGRAVVCDLPIVSHTAASLATRGVALATVLAPFPFAEGDNVRVVPHGAVDRVAGTVRGLQDNITGSRLCFVGFNGPDGWRGAWFPVEHVEPAEQPATLAA